VRLTSINKYIDSISIAPFCSVVRSAEGPVLLRYPSCRILRAADSSSAVPEDVGVDHGRGDLVVAEKLLDGPDVMAALQKVRGEGAAERVAARACRYRRADGAGHRTLNVRLAVVMPAFGGLAPPPCRGGNFRSIASDSHTRPNPAARSS
jgi:hypothetical protein